MTKTDSKENGFKNNIGKKHLSFLITIIVLLVGIIVQMYFSSMSDASEAVDLKIAPVTKEVQAVKELTKVNSENIIVNSKNIAANTKGIADLDKKQAVFETDIKNINKLLEKIDSNVQKIIDKP